MDLRTTRLADGVGVAGRHRGRRAGADGYLAPAVASTARASAHGGFRATSWRGLFPAPRGLGPRGRFATESSRRRLDRLVPAVRERLLPFAPTPRDRSAAYGFAGRYRPSSFAA